MSARPFTRLLLRLAERALDHEYSRRASLRIDRLVVAVEKLRTR